MDLNHDFIIYMYLVKYCNRNHGIKGKEKANLLINETLNLDLNFLATKTKIRT